VASLFRIGIGPRTTGTVKAGRLIERQQGFGPSHDAHFTYRSLQRVPDRRNTHCGGFRLSYSDIVVRIINHFLTRTFRHVAPTFSLIAAKSTLPQEPCERRYATAVDDDSVFYWPRLDVGKKSAIDKQCLTGDVRSVIRCEERNGRGHFFR
jgi:hypothetical protein